MTNHVSISGLSKAKVLAALFNSAEAPRQMGALQFQSGPYVMTERWAEELIGLGHAGSPDYGGISLPGKPKLYFDYLYGRCLKTDLTSDDSFDPWGFDRDNGGEGTAQKVIECLRETDEVRVMPTVTSRIWLQQVIDKALKRYDDGDLGGAIAQFIVGTAQHPGTQHIPEFELTAPLVVMSFQEGRQSAERAMAGFAV